MNPNSDILDVDDITRAAVHKRTLSTLWVSAVFSRGAVSSMFPVSVLAIKDMLGSDTWAGLATGAATVGAAVSAMWLANVSRRHGRTPALSGGFVVAMVGGLLAIVAIQLASLLLFLPAMVLVGVGTGTSTLSRYAAADLTSDARRSRDIGTVVFAATFGAVVFPLFIGVAGDVAESVSLDANAGGFAMAIVFFAIAGGSIWFFMRPDPLVVAGGVDPNARRKNGVPFRQAVAIMWARPLARLAFIALIVVQAVMVMVMAMTPLHMEEHGHGNGTVGAVISAHTAGMFAFAPLAGWFSDRIGRLPTIAIGAVTLVLATILTALAGEAPRLLMFPGLFLLGLGWSFGFVAGSALLTEAVEVHDRVTVQGAADLATNIASGSGALASGLVLSMSGFHTLSLVGMSAAGALLVHAYFEHRLAIRTAVV